MPSVAALWAGWRRAGSRIPVVGGVPPAVTFPTTMLVIRVRIALGADPAADPSTWLWEDITSYVRIDPTVTVSEGRPDEAGTVDTSEMTLVLDNSDGRFSRRNPASPYWGLLSRSTPVWVTADPGTGEYDVAKLFIIEWPARWDRSGNDATVPVACAGLLRRLS